MTRVYQPFCHLPWVEPSHEPPLRNCNALGGRKVQLPATNLLVEALTPKFAVKKWPYALQSDYILHHYPLPAFCARPIIHAPLILFSRIYEACFVHHAYHLRLYLRLIFWRAWMWTLLSGKGSCLFVLFIAWEQTNGRNIWHKTRIWYNNVTPLRKYSEKR